jgi:wyosine [tRNA(Phe)-imidazoG37] synthetase (radical SAM superfamily)
LVSKSVDISALDTHRGVVPQSPAGLAMLVFGPVPSRRLGRSLGLNNVPAKSCSYSCIYCQLGPTKRLTADRTPFYEPEHILSAARKQLDSLSADDRAPDYLTFVPDGEPSLDMNLKSTISLLRELDTPIAVISNASMIWVEEVRDAFLEADLVSLKADAITERVWRQVNRPHRSLSHERILEGVVDFSKEFSGDLITETMLISSIHYDDELEPLAMFLSEISPKKSYIAVPTRPPCEEWVKPVDEGLLNRAFQIFASKLGHERVEYLIGYEGDAFASTGDVVHDLLSITSVHPMREDAVSTLLVKNNADWSVVDRLLSEGKMVKLEYGGHTYYARKLGAFR